MFETIQYEVRDRVGIIALNRPKQLNTLSFQMREELHSLIHAINSDTQVRSVLLWGSESLFGAGADIVGSRLEKPTPITSYESSQALHRLCDQIAAIPKPTVCAVAGYCLGGSLEMALSCDIRFVSENARVGLTEVNLGSIPGAGGTQRLPRLIGPSFAKETLFTGAKYSGADVYRMGMANYLVKEGELFDSAFPFARQMATRAPLAMAQAKACVDKGLEMGIDEGMDLEGRAMGLLTLTEDLQEGARAFKEKRPADFQGK